MQIIQFCDNCAGQYKSKGPFQFVSESEIPILRMFFGARHGKGPADGVVGRIKSAAKRAVKSRKVVIRNAREFYNFCKVQFKHTAYDPSKSDQNFTQEFFFVEDIPRDDSEVIAVTTHILITAFTVLANSVLLKCGRFLVMKVAFLEMGKTVSISHMHQSGKQSICTLVKLLLKKMSGICIGI